MYFMRNGQARAKERALNACELLEQRQLHSVAVLQKIESLLLTNIHAMLPGSLLGKALHYISGPRAKLTLYVTNGTYPIDNNACDNSIRPFVIGRRNWFSPTRSLAPMPAPICVRYFRPARSMAFKAICFRTVLHLRLR